jgi:polyhydroxyalkanoate synthesis regulator phasin
MSDRPELDDLVDRLVHMSRLSRSEAAHLVDEVLAFFDEPLEEFVRRRHGALQRNGCSNRESFARVQEEVAQRRFRVARLTERQIRRLIYG